LTTADGGASNVHPAIRPLGLTANEQDQLVAFLRSSLTDRRVACQQAPFDHPALRVFNGHTGDATSVVTNKNDVKGVDDFIDIPATGAKGMPVGQCLKDDTGKKP
jgi:hypothetical protein